MNLLTLLEPPKPHTQTGQVLQALQRGPVCSFSFYHQPTLTHRLAARIYDLKQKGYTIVRGTCHAHNHEGAAVEYRLQP